MGWLGIELDKTTDSQSISDVIDIGKQEYTGKLCPELTKAYGEATECIGENCQIWDEDDCGFKRK